MEHNYNLIISSNQLSIKEYKPLVVESQNVYIDPNEDIQVSLSNILNRTDLTLYETREISAGINLYFLKSENLKFHAQIICKEL